VKLDVRENITESEFVKEYVIPNKPVVIKNTLFDAKKWTPHFVKELMGDLSVQVYDALFTLQEISTLSNYIDNQFGVSKNGESYRKEVPYIRWYSQLKDTDYAWSNEAFARMAPHWEKPDFLPDENLIVPHRTSGEKANPVTDLFPYRGLLIAARGARTRMHRDPFCSDAMVSQFYGEKEVCMYHPDRSAELTVSKPGSTSFGGFLDVRSNDLNSVSVEPDYHGFIGPGDIVYVPHGWLHDVIVTEDSISVTWNFIHESGALEFIDYLMDSPEKDSEFEVLKYFYSLVGEDFESANEIVKKYNNRFSQIEEILMEMAG